MYREIAEAYALDAVDFARGNMNLELNWHDESIQLLESILDMFHKDFVASKPAEDQILTFSKMWGSYLGEVFRKNHGATWGLITTEERSIPGLKATSGIQFWPWQRVANRIQSGPEDNVWHYYLRLTE